MAPNKKTPRDRPGRLRLRQLSFGEIDATHEVITRRTSAKDHFKTSFVAPTGLSIEEFEQGERYFIYGMKGAGKTAFLRYVQLHVEEKACLTKFISFATDIQEETRARLAKTAGIEFVDQKDIEIEKSAVTLWQLYLLRVIVNVIGENRKLFSTNQDTNHFIEIVTRIHDGGLDDSALSWISKLLKGGKYKLKSKWVEFSGKGQKHQEKDYPIDIIISKCMSLIKSLAFETESRMYIFVDELNLSLTSKAQHKRDATLIRDLVIAVDRLNHFFTEENKPIYITAAVRSEVLNAMNAPTQEINKMLSDRGRELRWFAHSASEIAPISLLVQHKIEASEKIVWGTASGEDIWTNYFRNSIYHMNPKQFIVEITWCNPRDVVILFGNSAREAANEDIFDEKVFDRVLARYSSEVWKEKMEELNVEYAQIEITSIKKCFTAFACYFRLSEFEDVLRSKGSLDQNVLQLSKTRKPLKVLEDLCRIGVLGQSAKAPTGFGTASFQFNEHWRYRGDETFDSRAYFVVHRALWPEFRLGQIRPNYSD